MSLIDNDNFEQKKETDEKKDLKCKECNKNLVDDTPILLCENCFNKSIKNVLEKIIENIQRVRDEINKINTNLEIIAKELKKDNHHIIVINKLEIDQMNLKAIKEKYLIDEKLNLDAFNLNQIQANKLRELMKWTLFDIKNIDDELK